MPVEIPVSSAKSLRVSVRDHYLLEVIIIIVDLEAIDRINSRGIPTIIIIMVGIIIIKEITTVDLTIIIITIIEIVIVIMGDLGR